MPTDNSENAIVEKNEQPVQVQQESTEFDRQALNLYLERVNQLEAIYYDLNQKYKHEKEKNNVVRITEVRKKYYSEEFSKISNWCDFGFLYSGNSFFTYIDTGLSTWRDPFGESTITIRSIDNSGWENPKDLDDVIKEVQKNPRVWEEHFKGVKISKNYHAQTLTRVFWNVLKNSANMLLKK